MPSQASFDLDNTTPPLYGDALQVGVYLYTPGAGSPFALVPNVRCLRIDYREGPEPPVARFEYVMDDSLALNFGWPAQFEQLWPIDAQGPYVIKADDRVIAMAQNPDGSNLILFDGFAQIPQVDVTPRSQRVTFAAVGVAVRCWDNPILGRVQRGADPISINDTSGNSDVQVDLPCRFNPADNSLGGDGGYLPNRTPDGKDTITGDGALDHPVFLDPGIERSPDPRGYWTVADAVKYILAEYNEAQAYVNFPTFATLDSLLGTHYPARGFQVMNPDNPSSFETDGVRVRDYDASNKPWPEAVADLVSYCGFFLRWDTSTDLAGNPLTELKLYRRDEFTAVIPKVMCLAEARTAALDPSANNITQLHLARDANRIVNAWEIETQQRQVEVSIVLAPLYQPEPGDASSSSRKQFFMSNLSTAAATTRRKYRWYGADECGDGHWTRAQAWATTPMDFSDIFPPDDDGSPSYTVRYRPGSNTLISRDSGGKPMKADLAISFDYEGDIPSPWDGSGTWQSIPHGWRLLEDRLGIEVTVEDPEQWNAGKGAAQAIGGVGSTTLVPGGDIRGITWWAQPPSGTPTNGHQPVLRLTTVIEDDLRMPISVNKRIASPTRFTRWRSADARDHFQYASIDPSSMNYTQAGGNGTDPYVVRDDTDAAMTHAYQLRSAHEFPPLAGSITIPFITTYYEIGDRISMVKGRDASLQTNIGIDQGEAACYPWVVGVSWDFTGDRQRTVLQLTDRRAEVRNP